MSICSSFKLVGPPLAETSRSSHRILSLAVARAKPPTPDLLMLLAIEIVSYHI